MKKEIVLKNPIRRGAEREIHVDNKYVGTWGRIYNGKSDRGVKLGTWHAVLKGNVQSPNFDTRHELIDWIGQNLIGA